MYMIVKEQTNPNHQSKAVDKAVIIENKGKEMVSVKAFLISGTLHIFRKKGTSDAL